MHYARVRDSATTRKYAGIPQGGMVVSRWGVQRYCILMQTCLAQTAPKHPPHTQPPEYPSTPTYPQPPIPRYTPPPGHPPRHQTTRHPNHPSQPPDTRTTNPTTHTPIAVHPATNPDQTPKPPGHPTNTRPGTQPTQTHTRPPEASSRPFRVWANPPRPDQTRPQHGDTRPPRPPNPPVTRYRDEVEPGFYGFPPRGTPVTPPGSWW